MRSQPTLDASTAKQLGAYYTPPPIAAKLADWAIQSPRDCVLDPSFGGLVFLGAATSRLCNLGASRADAATQLYGVELDHSAYAEALRQKWLRLNATKIINADFFELEPGPELPPCQALIGNPPYIRYQGFNGRSALAHRRAAEAGVRLSRLASSWAPFVIHATSFLQSGGRLALVLPAELLHAQYASEVLDFLASSFARLTVVSFEQRVFPGAEEEIVLLLGEDRGATRADSVELLSCRDVEDFLPDRRPRRRPSSHDIGSQKLLFQLLDRPTQRLYFELAARPEVSTLGAHASVDIGVVTGDNHFFLLSRAEAEAIGIRHFRLAVSKARQLRGARLTENDLAELTAAGERLWMFAADGSLKPRAAALRAYLARGERSGVPRRYKARIRDPWWALPLPAHGVAPDLFLTYCSSEHPRLLVNSLGALSTNTVHAVHLTESRKRGSLAAAFPNSLTLLSAELVGRSYGGGVLKLEPTEAEQLLIPPLAGIGTRLSSIDRRLRTGSLSAVLELTDSLLLEGTLGLGAVQVNRLRAAAEQLRLRRRNRGRTPRSSGHQPQ